MLVLTVPTLTSDAWDSGLALLPMPLHVTSHTVCAASIRIHIVYKELHNLCISDTFMWFWNLPAQAARNHCICMCLWARKG